MKGATQQSCRGFFSLLLSMALILCWDSNALMIGRRRIQCSTPIGGNPDNDALMDSRPNLPYILGFVGCQAFLPTLGQCPKADQWQPPWFTGVDVGGGICPPEYYNLAAAAPGLAIIGAGVAWASYIESNRLLVTNTGIGTLPKNNDIKEFEETVLFKDVEDWFMTPVGLVVKSSETTSFFPLTWDQKSVEAVLEERIPKN